MTVYQGWAAEQVEQTQDAVHLRVRKQAVTSSGKLVPGQEHLTVRGRYVIGADGAKSFLLQHMRTSLTNLGFLFDWLVVDIIPHEQREWNPINLQICDPVRPRTVVSGGKGRLRWEFMCLPGESVEELNRAETVWRLPTPWNSTPENATPSTPLRRAGPIPGAMGACFSQVTRHTLCLHSPVRRWVRG